ncbi:MAG: permease [Candidatus Eisenbacteria bacterium]|nr:permease [Candidatus Eisenbacteria bacterium]
MLAPTIVIGVVAIALLAIGYVRGEGQHLTGLQYALRMTLSMLPLLLLAMVVAGMVQVLIPKEPLARWIGAESGLRGILLGTVAGALAPGGPYVSMPLAAGMLQAGAGIGTMVAFLTGWSLWAIGRLPLEVGILGWKFTLIRLVSTLVFPPIAGLIAQFFFGQTKV